MSVTKRLENLIIMIMKNHFKNINGNIILENHYEKTWSKHALEGFKIGKVALIMSHMVLIIEFT